MGVAKLLICEEKLLLSPFLPVFPPKMLTNIKFKARPAPLSLALACALGGGWAHANPVGGVAVHGTAQMSNPAANQLVVTTTNGAGTNHSVINWQSFSIPGGSTTQIVQPNAGSLSINRVTTTNNPSLIYGTLSSNGQVLLVNPAGVTVGAGAVVDTAGFQASTLGLSEADAIAGRLRFEGAGGDIQVQGQVVAREGDVVLLAPQVTVEAGGVVRAPNGSVVLAAGQKAELTGRGLEGIQLQVQAPGDRAVNLGTLSGDAVGIFAGTLKHSGVIQATAVTTEGGRVVLKAQELAEIGGTTRAERLERLGGLFQATARLVDVKSDAVIDASGAQGGGEVLIGGGWQGNDARVANAQQTLVRSGAQIKADATENGDGGTVVVWADGATRYEGSISARGGEWGGNGGRVEVSGKQWLGFAGQVDTRAPHGTRGVLLLDPTDLEIGTLNNLGGALLGSLGVGDGPASSQVTALEVGVLLTTTSLSLAASNNITVSDAITKTAGLFTTTLTLDAGNAIVLNAPISTLVPLTGQLNLTMNAGAGGVTQAAGAGFTGGDLQITTTAGGNVSLHTVDANSINVNAAGAITQTGGTLTSAGAIDLSGLTIGNSTTPVVVSPGGQVTLTATTTSGVTTDGIYVRQAPGNDVNTGLYIIHTDVGTTQTVSVAGDGINVVGTGDNGFNTMSGSMANDIVRFTAEASGGSVTVGDGRSFVARSVEFLAKGAGGNVALGTTPTGGTLNFNLADGLTARSQQRDVVVSNHLTVTNGADITLGAARDVQLNTRTLTTAGGDITVVAAESDAAGAVLGGGSLVTTAAAAAAGAVTVRVDSAAGAGGIALASVNTNGANNAVGAGFDAGNVTLHTLGSGDVTVDTVTSVGGNGGVTGGVGQLGGNGGDILVKGGGALTLRGSGIGQVQLNSSGGRGGDGASGNGGAGGAAGTLTLEATTGLTLSYENILRASGGNGGLSSAGNGGAGGAAADVMLKAGAAGVTFDLATVSDPHFVNIHNFGGLGGSGVNAGADGQQADAVVQTTGGGDFAQDSFFSFAVGRLKLAVDGDATAALSSAPFPTQPQVLLGQAVGNITVSGVDNVGNLTSTGGDISLTNAAATLQVDGTVSAADISLTAANIDVYGQLQPGGSGGLGTLTLNGPTTFQSGSVLQVDFHGNSHDTVSAANGVTFVSGAQVVANATTQPALGSYAILTGTTTGTLPALSGTVSNASLRFGSLYLDVTAPSTTTDTLAGSVDSFTPLFDQAVGTGESVDPEEQDVAEAGQGGVVVEGEVCRAP